MTQHAPQRNAHDGADERQDEQLLVDIDAHLALAEAQYLDRGQLALALRDVGGGEREQHHERQARGQRRDECHHVVDEHEVALEVADAGGHARDREERRVASELVCEGDLLVVRAVELGEQGVGLERLAKEALVAVLGEVDGVAEVVHHDAAHLDVCLVERRVLQAHAVALAKAQHHGRVLGEQGPAVCGGAGKVEVPAVLRAQVDVAVERKVVGHHDELHGLLGAVVLDRDVLIAHGHVGVHAAAIGEPLGGHLEVCGLRGGEQVVGVDARAACPAVLVGREGLHGVVDAKAHDHEGAAAGHAKHRHGQAALVAEEVARRDLVEEGEAAPHGADVLEQDALASARGLGAHEGRGALGELAAHGDERGGADAHHEQAKGQGAQARAEVQGKGRQRVHHGKHGEEELGQRHKAQQRAHAAAREGRGDGVAGVLGHDAAARVAQRLVQANEAALLLDHARGRGDGHEDGHGEEDRREDGADDLDGARVGVDRGVARDGRAVLDVPGGAANVGELGARVGDFGEGVGLLPLELGAGVVELGLAVCRLGRGVAELGGRLVELRQGEVALLVELRLGVVELGGHLGELLVHGGVRGCLGGRDARLGLLDEGGEGLDRGALGGKGGLDARHLRLYGVELGVESA